MKNSTLLCRTLIAAEFARSTGFINTSEALVAIAYELSADERREKELNLEHARKTLEISTEVA